MLLQLGYSEDDYLGSRVLFTSSIWFAQPDFISFSEQPTSKAWAVLF